MKQYKREVINKDLQEAFEELEWAYLDWIYGEGNELPGALKTFIRR
jgi:hypothetical protein